MLSGYPKLYVPLVRRVNHSEIDDTYVRAGLPSGHPEGWKFRLDLSSRRTGADVFTERDIICRDAVLIAQAALYARHAPITDDVPRYADVHEHYDIAVTPDGLVYLRPLNTARF